MELLRLSVIVAVAPLLPGLANRVKAFFAGRQGPSVFQLYYDLAKLGRKGVVLSPTTTWVFRLGPLFGLAATLAAACLLPVGRAPGPAGFNGDFIVFVYLLALGRFLLTLAALDTGSAFAGLGVARELAFSGLSELALFLGLLSLDRLSGSPRLGAMLGVSGAGLDYPGQAALALAAAAFFALLFAENGRGPVEGPDTHLELTMVHEVMILDQSGPLLGVSLLAAALKLALFTALLTDVVVPDDARFAGAAWLVPAAAWAGVALAVGLVESVLARLKLRRVPAFLAAACLLGGFSLLLSLR